MNAQALKQTLDLTPKRSTKVQIVSDVVAQKMADMQALMDCINGNAPECIACIRASYCKRRDRAL